MDLTFGTFLHTAIITLLANASLSVNIFLYRKDQLDIQLIKYGLLIRIWPYKNIYFQP